MPINNLYKRVRVSCLMLLLLPTLAAAEFRPFSSGSLKQITNARSGQPFLLVLWSVDCPPCLKELQEIGQLKSQFTPNGLVLISTDSTDLTADVQQILAQYGLADAENWQFTAGFPERLRYQIDPNWYGELPRAYFYDAQHKRAGKSGALSRELLQQFIEQLH